MVYSIISKSELEGALRLDAEYYQPEYLDLVDKLLKTQSYKLWGDIEGKFITGPFGSEFNVENYVNESNFRYVRGRDVKEFFLLGDNNVYIPQKDFERLQKYSLKEGDILISVVGTLGNTSLVDNIALPAIFSCKSTAYRSDAINPYYFVAYLNSKYGRNLLIRNVRGHVQTGLNIDDLKSLVIFVPSNEKQEEIAFLVKTSWQEQENSKSLYSQAENLFLEELGLKNFKIEENLSFVINLSEIKSARRTDAEYFQPKYEKIFDYIKRPIKKLGEITKFLNHAKQPPYVKDGEIPIITQKHLGKTCINLELINDPETKFTNSDWIEHNPSFKLQKGDILYYSVGAYIGKTNVVLEDINAVSASFITIMRLKEEIDPIYLVVVLNSIVGQLQSDKWQSATAQQYIYPKDIKNFKIPILPKFTQQKIADLVKKAHQAREKSKELLEEAKRKVETSIEAQSKGNN